MADLTSLGIHPRFREAEWAVNLPGTMWGLIVQASLQGAVSCGVHNNMERAQAYYLVALDLVCKLSEGEWRGLESDVVARLNETGRAMQELLIDSGYPDTLPWHPVKALTDG
jgi:hypothetical protein